MYEIAEIGPIYLDWGKRRVKNNKGKIVRVSVTQFPLRPNLFQVSPLSSPPKPSPESYSTVPKILSDIYKSQQGELDEDHRDYFWIEDHLSEKTNIIKHHPMSHNYESSTFGNTAHHLKFDFNLKEHEQHHRTELFLHTEQMANNSLINLYKVCLMIRVEHVKSQSHVVDLWAMKK